MIIKGRVNERKISVVLRNVKGKKLILQDREFVFKEEEISCENVMRSTLI